MNEKIMLVVGNQWDENENWKGRNIQRWRRTTKLRLTYRVLSSKTISFINKNHWHLHRFSCGLAFIPPLLTLHLNGFDRDRVKSQGHLSLVYMGKAGGKGMIKSLNGIGKKDYFTRLRGFVFWCLSKNYSVLRGKPTTQKQWNLVKFKRK